MKLTRSRIAWIAFAVLFFGAKTIFYFTEGAGAA